MKNYTFAGLLSLFIFSSLFCATTTAPNESFYAQDTTYPNIYFNMQRFPDGLFAPAGTSLLTRDNFDTATIIWDLNQVVFKKRDKKEGITEALGKYGIITSLYASNAMLKAWNRKNAYKKLNDGRGFVWEAVVLEEQDPSLQTILYEAIADGSNLDLATLTVLKELAYQGNRNVVLSNMGQGLATRQIDKLKSRLSQLEEQISDLDYKDQNTLLQLLSEKNDLLFVLHFLQQPENIVASQENNWLHKPDSKSYEAILKNTAPTDGTKRLSIFIDDKERNIIAAVQDGLCDIGIRFTNAQDLRTILHALSQRKKEIGKESDAIKLLHVQKTENAQRVQMARFKNFFNQKLKECQNNLETLLSWFKESRV